MVAAAGCGGPQIPGAATTPDAEGVSSGRAAGPKRVVVAIPGTDPGFLSTTLGDSDALEEMTSAGLATFDDRGVLRPELAETVPALENGLWRVFPDGRMETTWRIRQEARWHDGVPITSDDLLFTAAVSQDRELAVFRHAGFDLMDGIEASDGRTVTVSWKRPYIDADTMFTRSRGGRPFGLPLPKHLLERAYIENKASFTEIPYWTQDFVGSGPFKLREWARGSHLVLAANDWYPPGRPRIDELEIRFIPDKNTLIANILSGEVDLTTETNAVGVDEAVLLRDRWRDGRIDIRFSSWIPIYPQFLNPRPTVVGDVRFRRALLHAIDRQQLVDTFMAGLAPIAHGYLSLEEPAYEELERSLVRYDYDPRKATQLLEELGYRKGTDGVFRDSANQVLSVGLRARSGAEEEQLIFAVGDQWQRLGVALEPEVVPRQLARDREYQATFPSFFIRRHNNNLTRLSEFHSSQLPGPENSFRGGNIPRYSDPEFDALIDRFVVTIPMQERNQLAGQIIRHLSDQLVLMGLFYNAETTMISNRLLNVVGRTQVTEVWSCHLWDVKL